MPASNHEPHQGTIEKQRIKIIKKEKEKENLRLKAKGAKTFVSLSLLGKFGQVNLCVSLFLGSHGGRERSESEEKDKHRKGGKEEEGEEEEEGNVG